MDKYILLFAIYSRKYSSIWSLSIDITVLEAYFSNYYLFVIIGYIRIDKDVCISIYIRSSDTSIPLLRTVNIIIKLLNIHIITILMIHNYSIIINDYYY